MNENRILIIDDEPDIRSFLRTILEGDKENHRWIVSEAANGREGLAETAKFHPHLVILDLGLPDMHGSEVLKSLRKWTDIPVLILTVEDSEKSLVALLDDGANDYLTKPFKTPELLARVRVALRSHHAVSATPIFKSGDLEIDLNEHVVRRSGEVLELTATEFQLLSRLVRGNGHVVSHETLLREIWGVGAEDKPHYLRIYVGHVRKKIEVNPSAPQHLITDAGIGYRLV